MGVLGAPVYMYSGGAIRSIYKCMRYLYMKMVASTVPNVLTVRIPYKAAPIRFFKIVWDLYEFLYE